MAVATLLLWLCTAAVGSYLLATAIRAGNVEPAPGEPVGVAAEQTAAAGAAHVGEGAAGAGTARQVPDDAPAPAPAKVRRSDRDLFAPPSLQAARNEPLPGMRALAEFAHPALAIIGIGFWLGYVVSRDRLFAVIGLGVLLGAICAGLSLFTVNARAARRLAVSTAPAPTTPGAAPLTASTLVLTLHGIGATLTLLFAILIAVGA
ncbi:MAG: hypothetical protein ACRDNS_18580 [Trebonia sp.]